MKRTNNRYKKSPTSSNVDGPPMFKKTIAVGPFDPAAFCVTGGTGVANDLVCNRMFLDGRRVNEGELAVAVPAALRASCATECRAVILHET